MKYKDDRQWADSYLPVVAAILKSNAMHLVNITVAPPEQDATEATDMVVTVTGGTVAVRIRRDECRWRDLTLRSWRASGHTTELAKVKAGFAKWYLYAWTTQGRITEWVLVDMDVARATVLQREWPQRTNPDGRTKFIAISREELRRAGCLVAAQ